MDSKRCVLIVDDNKSQRELLTAALENQYDVLCVDNGRRALDVIGKQGGKISAVVLDVVMPVLDGYNVLRELRVNPITGSLPVIVVAADDESHKTELRSFLEGASDFVPKPCDVEILRIRLKKCIETFDAKSLAGATERDSLTGIYNKEAFYRRVEDRLDCGTDAKCDIVALDIENFKLINDKVGIDEGDKILKYIAKLISGYACEVGGICARRGSDQFLLFIPSGDKYIDEITSRMSVALEKFSPELIIGVKFGIYEIFDKSVSVTAMCDRAMLAVKKVKGKYGKAYANYDDSIRKQLLIEQMIADDMKAALAKGEFKVFMQPKYDISNDRICGAEALIRWEHPKLGFLMPSSFIPQFEQNGFIAELDTFVFERTCQVISGWLRDYNKYVPVSVNISRRDIYDPMLIEKLVGNISKYGLKPHHIHLEITETAYTEDHEQLVDIVQKLKDLGFIIEMDDFGSGYSSLNMLSELPIDVLKLDMRFMKKNIQPNSSGRNMSNIVSFIISLARWLNLQVVAEGVEIQNQLKMLRDMDCNFAQGYLYAKPLPIDKFTELLKASEICIPDNSAEHSCFCVEKAKVNPNKKTMLVVDDMDASRALLSEVFGEEYNLVEFTNGIAALNYVEHNTDSVDIIMLDLVMPQMDGFQLLERIRSNSAYDYIPVMIVSQSNEQSQMKVLNMGADGFIEKPVNGELARWSVKRMLGYYNQKRELNSIRAI